MIYDLITSFKKILNLYVVSKSTNKHRLKVCLVKAAQNYEQNQKQYSSLRSREFFTNFVTHYQVSLDEIFGILPMANRILGRGSAKISEQYHHLNNNTEVQT